MTLPSKCIGSGVVTIEDLTNILAEKILMNNHDPTDSDYHIDEVMTIFPNLQFGMNLNPKFTDGPNGAENTIELNAFRLLQIELVHGWLLDPRAQEYDWVKDKTYNELTDLVIRGDDAGAHLQAETPASEDPNDELSAQATAGTIISTFLERTANQLTQYGLSVLYEQIRDGDIVVFFRNNHFNTLTKYGQNLYLLVTDLGYASVNCVVWEKLDMIDGDTEYVTGTFKVPAAIENPVSGAATGEQLVANNLQSRSDYHLALQLSREANQGAAAATRGSKPKQTTAAKQEQSDIEKAKYASLLEHQYREAASDGRHNSYTTPTPEAPTSRDEKHPKPTIAVGIPMTEAFHHDRDLELALQLQREERELEGRIREQKRMKQRSAKAAAAAKDDSKCVIS